jgi:plasmid stability protein
MKTTLELPEDLVQEIEVRAEHEGKTLNDAVTHLLRKGLAAELSESCAQVRADQALMERRKAVAEKFISGEWGAELAGFEEGRSASRDVLQRLRRERFTSL